MQYFDPVTISQKILTTILPEFMTQLNKASNLKAVQQHCLGLCNKLVFEAWQDHKVILKSTKEPQSEAEESKEE